MTVIIYCVNLLLVNLIGLITTVYLRRNPQLTSEIFTPQLYRSLMRLYVGVNMVYVICIVLAFWLPVISCIVISVMTAFLIIRSVVMMGVGKCNARWNG